MSQRVTTASLLVLLASNLALFSSEQPELAEDELVTAIDVLVEVEATTEGGKLRELPTTLERDDFKVWVDGEARTVVGVLDPRVARDADDEPWTTVIYLDAGLSEQRSLRWSALELAHRAEELVALGTVEIVEAGPDSIRALAPTRDLDLIEGRLSGLALDPPVSSHQAVELRAEYLELTAEPTEEPNTGDALEQVAVVEWEAAQVGARLDRLLLHLFERESTGSKNAIFLVSDGFDLEPAGFYRAHGAAVPGSVGSLRGRVAELSRTLAGFGWVVFCMAPPEEDPGLILGKRIGKWLVRPASSGLIGFRATHEERRDPEKAEGYLDLGRVYLEAGSLKEAEPSFELALYHFAGDPRTAKKQAAAKAGLGQVLELLDRRGEARLLFRHAEELDPELAGTYLQARPRLLAPTEPLQEFADATAGRLISNAEELDQALAGLANRVLVTYQRSGPASGEVQRLELSFRDATLELKMPRWARSGVPGEVSAARARTLLAGELVKGEIEFDLEVQEDSDGDWVLQLNGPRAPDFDRLRLTIATGHPEGPVSIRDEEIALENAGAEGWSHRTRIDPVAVDAWLAVVVDDIATGQWGGLVIEEAG